MTTAEFMYQIGLLQKLYGYEMPKDLYAMYWAMFGKYDTEQFKGAVQGIVKKFVPTASVKFPLPAHFLEAIGETGANRSRLAVNAVKRAIGTHGAYASVDFGDGALHRAIRSMGGWVEVCSWSNEVWGYREKAFLQAYEAESTVGGDYCRPVGIHEANNAMISTDAEQRRGIGNSDKPKAIPWAGYVRQDAIEHTGNDGQCCIDVSGDIKAITDSIGGIA